jgi:hypothetical protein
MFEMVGFHLKSDDLVTSGFRQGMFMKHRYSLPTMEKKEAAARRTLMELRVSFFCSCDTPRPCPAKLASMPLERFGTS